MPSMWMSSRLNADEHALRAKRATKSHSFCNMFGDVQKQKVSGCGGCVVRALYDGADAFHEKCSSCIKGDV